MLVGNQADAIKAHQAVQNGEDWNKVAKQYSIPPGPPQTGGYLQGYGRPGRDQLRGGRVRRAETGTLSDLIEVSKSYADSSLQGKCKPKCYFVVQPKVGVSQKGHAFRRSDEAKAQILQSLQQTQQEPKLQKRIQALLAAQKKITKYAQGYTPAAPSASGTTSP